jgi:hypothetical protein
LACVRFHYFLLLRFFYLQFFKALFPTLAFGSEVIRVRCDSLSECCAAIGPCNLILRCLIVLILLIVSRSQKRRVTILVFIKINTRFYLGDNLTGCLGCILIEKAHLSVS